MENDTTTTIDAVMLRRKISQMQARAQHSAEHGSRYRAKALSDVVRMIDRMIKYEGREDDVNA